MASFSLTNSNSIPNASLPFPTLPPAPLKLRQKQARKLPGAPSPTPPPRHDTTPQQSRQGYATAPPCPLAPLPLGPPLQSQQQPPHPSKPVLTSPPPALVVVVPKDKFTTSGPIKKWKGTADSGNAVYRWFCSECGSPIAHDPEAAPVIAIKGGTLDVEIKKGLKPVSFFSFFFGLFLRGAALMLGHPQDTEIWTAGKLPFCQEKLAHPFEHMPQ